MINVEYFMSRIRSYSEVKPAALGPHTTDSTPKMRTPFQISTNENHLKSVKRMQKMACWTWYICFVLHLFLRQLVWTTVIPAYLILWLRLPGWRLISEAQWFFHCFAPWMVANAKLIRSRDGFCSSKTLRISQPHWCLGDLNFIYAKLIEVGHHVMCGIMM